MHLCFNRGTSVLYFDTMQHKALKFLFVRGVEEMRESEKQRVKEKKERRWVGQSHSSGPANLSTLVLQAQRPECTRNQRGISPDNEAFSLQTNIQLVAFICPPVWRTLQHITALISSAHKVKYEVRLTGKKICHLTISRQIHAKENSSLPSYCLY